jgi:hypothetical protein
MPETKSTILIPDISGFTEFMTTTELTHASHALNYLIDAILNAVGDEFEVAEIEGDAVLLIKKGPPPSKKKIRETCLRIFNAFHYQRKWMQQHTICPCGACMAIINLTLKFVVHHGPLSEIKVGRFVKPSGTEMIVAHRLLKNSIESNEYLLMTEKLLQEIQDDSNDDESDWIRSTEEYAAIGKIDYQFTLLNQARSNVPDPPPVENDYRTDNTPLLETTIEANYFDTYLVASNIPGREGWMPGLKKVEQDVPGVFIGSVHRCTFDGYEAIVSPLRMTSSSEGIMLAETYFIPGYELSLICELLFRKIDNNTCRMSGRFLNSVESPIPDELNVLLGDQLKCMADSIKALMEKNRSPELQH